MPKAATKPVAEPTAEESPLVEIEFNGQTFTVPRDADDWPTVAYLARLTAITSGRTMDWLKFMELLLGAAQWQRVVDSTNAGQFREFLNTAIDAIKKECKGL